MSSCNLYGGTPKKTLDLMKHFGGQSSIYIYLNASIDFKHHFEDTGGKVHEGFYGRNLYKHVKALLEIVDKEKINIIQTQFNMGETLGFLLKAFRPQIKLIVAFVGSLKQKPTNALLASCFYRYANHFVYISEYVRQEKAKQFPFLNDKNGSVILNGTEIRTDTGNTVVEFKKFSLFDIAGLIELKNIQILIRALNILVNIRNRKNLYLYVAGDGPFKNELQILIQKYNLQKHVFLLGYQSNVGQLLNDCDLFVHPSYAEGFGIVIPEAMLANKPIIVSDAGALPELIEDGKSGLIVHPFDEYAWADAIESLVLNADLRKFLAGNAYEEAVKKFTVERFVNDYQKLYNSLLNEN